jgi:hypothetical protein
VIAVLGDVVDVEVRAPAGIALRPTIDRRTGHPNRRDRRLEGVLEQVGIKRLRRWQQAVRAAAGGGRVQADDSVEVDGATALELGHLGIGDPDQPPEPGLIAARAQRLAQPRVVLIMAVPAARPVAVG